VTVPSVEYARRLDARRDTHARLTRLDAQLSYTRLAVFAAGAGIAIALFEGWVSAWWLVAPLVAFAVLVVRHDRVIRSKDAAARAITFYDRGLARIGDRWAGGGETGERFRDAGHIYAQDLDLFGEGSLFELLSIARTRAGEETLASWLLTPADPPEIHARQQAIVDLTPRLDLREALSFAGTDVRASLHTDAVVAWAEGPPIFHRAWLRAAALVLTIAAVAAAVYAFASGDSTPFVVVVFCEIAFTLPLNQRATTALHGADGPARDLGALAVVLARLEGEQFAAERLTHQQQRLAGAGASDVTASVAIARLRRLVELHDWQHNMVFAPVAAAVLWGTHLALAVEAWRRVHGRDIREWLRICGEFEALASLSAYRYEHPDDPFPEIVVPDTRRALFDGTALGHPLIAAGRIVRNDVCLGEGVQLLVVSGSNMSGKSTLLRTVGVNAVLAFAGAPVRARRLRLTPLRIGATLRIQDSLQEGRSRFFAEITRVREIADLAAGPQPALFLLDELFHGTNSHDRIVGASGVLRALLDRHAIGLVTTHDLAVTKVADAVAPRASNIHFEERFEGGEMQFDYLVKPGPVSRSNAIALMRAVGLDVPPD
jgi:hypothetical protein